MIAITGASGLIGSVLAAGLEGDLRLLDINARPGVQELDLRDLTGVERAFEGVEKVVHLGAISSEAGFEDILDHNIRTTYNVYEAARRQGARRVVFASSNHAIGMYPRSQRIGADEPVRPDTYYGVSKAFGEALGRLYADKWGLEIACIRIGTVNDLALAPRRGRARQGLPRGAADLLHRLRRFPDQPRLVGHARGRSARLQGPGRRGRVRRPGRAGPE